MSSIFTKIVNGELPAHRVAENDEYLAFLDINPLKKGHTLVIPKQETDYIFDLPSEKLKGLFEFAQRVAKAIDKSIACKRVGVAVLGLEVPHAHVHLVPIEGEGDINFSNPKKDFTQDEFKEIARQISESFS